MDTFTTASFALSAMVAICAGIGGASFAQWRLKTARSEGMRLFAKAQGGAKSPTPAQDSQLEELAGLAAELSAAGISMSPALWRGMEVALAAVAVFAIFSVCYAGGGAVAAAVFSLAAVFGVHIGLGKLLKHRRDRRMLLFEKQLAQIELQIAENSRSGLSAARSVLACAEQTEDPLKTHLKRLYNEITYSDTTLAEGFANIARRTGSSDARLVAEVMSIQEQTGSNLADALTFLHETIVRRLEMRQMLRSSLAETRITRNIVAATPWAIFCFLSFAPLVKIDGFWDFYTTNPLGWAVLIGCVLIEATVLLFISRMANLRLD